MLETLYQFIYLNISTSVQSIVSLHIFNHIRMLQGLFQFMYLTVSASVTSLISDRVINYIRMLEASIVSHT